MYILNSITNIFLKWLGIEDSDEHDTPLTEEEIQASLSIAYAKGELTKNEHWLLNAVFRFDDVVASHIMKPRNEVEFLNANDSFLKNLQFARDSRHTRFPLCDDSLDKLIGVIHIKDIVGYNESDNIDLKKFARPCMLVPENILIGKLLQEFRNTRQHLAFVQDEHGTVLGIVTLEDVLEELVGNLQDEFDIEESDVVEQADGKYLINGDVFVDDLNERFDINLITEDADTLSGLIVERIGHKLEKNKVVELSEGVEAEIIDIDGIRVTKVRLEIKDIEKESNL